MISILLLLFAQAPQPGCYLLSSVPCPSPSPIATPTPTPSPSPPASISALYSGDVGIEAHPDVVLVEPFDDSVSALQSRWTDVKGAANMSLTADRPTRSPGGTSLRIAGPPDGGHLYQQLIPAITGSVYVRYYVKYPTGSAANHNGIWVGGYNPPSAWPNPGAGIRPLGDDRFSAAAEDRVEEGHTLDHYNYWTGMRPDAGGVYWGNVLSNAGVRTPLGQWVCVEQMVRLNNPVTAANGEHAIWLDGVKVSHLGQGFPRGHWTGGRFYQVPGDLTTFEGFRWRTTTALAINYVWLQSYTPVTFTELEFDHLVVARSYIGCLAP